VLAQAITATATGVTLQSGQGGRFPAIGVGTGDWFYATLIDSSNNLEHVKVTGTNGDAFVIQRAADTVAGSAVPLPFAAGARFEMRTNAQVLKDLSSRLFGGGEFTGPVTFDMPVTYKDVPTYLKPPQVPVMVAPGDAVQFGAANSTYLRVDGTSVMHGEYISNSVPYVNQGAFHVTNEIGGTFASWGTNRTYAVQVDAPNESAAYGGIRWTNWGHRHIAAIDAYGSAGGVPQIVMHIGSAANVYTFNGSGQLTSTLGSYWHTGNFNPANYQPALGYTPLVNNSAGSHTIGAYWNGEYYPVIDGSTGLGYMWRSGNFNPAAKADKSALVQWQSNVFEIAGANSPGVAADPGAPYVMVGMTLNGSGTAYNLRCVALKNQ
jgi:hypothetical protein